MDTITTTALPGLAELEGQLWRDLLAAERAYQESRSPEVGPSDARALHPRGCQRQLAYRVQLIEPTDPEPEWLVRQAVMGTAIHAHIAAARKAAHPDWLVEHPVQVPGFDRAGAVDACGDGTVDDIKTKSDRGFVAITNRGMPYDADRDQVLLYALGIEAEGHDVQRCSVTYVNRSDGETIVHSWTYDRAEALAVADRMHGLIDKVSLLAPEAIPRGGHTPDTRPCDSCPWLRRCWNLDDVPEGYSAPAWELAEEDVADHAEQLRQLRAQAAALKEATDYLTTTLQGHGGKTFTDSDGIERVISFTKAKAPGEGGHLDSTLVRAHYAAIGEDPPTLGTSPRLNLPAAKRSK